MNATTRSVRVGLMTYQRPDGRYRLAYAGDTVEVHPDFLARFDRINVVQGQEPAPATAESKLTESRPAEGDSTGEKPATKRRTIARKEP
ncbi:hypothetical protein [Nocardia transvalensis]|uniref:hypothetical protein n=1 Tax=Nocardia transvalensis TaxID=37333 RepID=UPI001893C106|nr:hypothetical protein [Nocardia transvalensis]MBF6328737.1 hypothetical protein [Nocardia transvalensis]